MSGASHKHEHLKGLIGQGGPLRLKDVLALAEGACVMVHRKKKVREFPVPSRDVTTKLSLGGNNDVIAELFLPRGSLVSDIPAGEGQLVNLFLRCSNCHLVFLLHAGLYLQLHGLFNGTDAVQVI
jgi:hypothetical protein